MMLNVREHGRLVSERRKFKLMMLHIELKDTQEAMSNALFGCSHPLIDFLFSRTKKYRTRKIEIESVKFFVINDEYKFKKQSLIDFLGEHQNIIRRPYICIDAENHQWFMLLSLLIILLLNEIV